MMDLRRRLIPFAGSAAIVLLDRVSKLWIESRMGMFDSWIILPGLLNIIHAENTGMAFSLFSDSGNFLRKFLLIGVSAALTILIGSMLWQASGRLQRASLSLLLGGAAGNIYDRALRGSVTDFIDVYIGSYHWPTFNIADSAITVGAGLLLLDLWRSRQPVTQHVS